VDLRGFVLADPAIRLDHLIDRDPTMRQHGVGIVHLIQVFALCDWIVVSHRVCGITGVFCDVAQGRIG